MECPSEPEGTGAEIDNRTAVMAVILGKSELLAGPDAFKEIGVARFRIRLGVDDVHDIRDGALEAFVDLAERALDVRDLSLAFEAFAFENDLAAV